MDMSTLPIERQRRASGGVPRSGGRTAVAESRGNQRRGGVEYEVDGATALQPRRAEATAPRRAGGTAPKEEAPRLTVAPPAPVSAPRAPFVALVLALVILGVVGILVLNTKIAENAFRLHDLKQQQSVLDLRQQGLERELAMKETPGELAAAATRLGLVPSRTPAFIVLPDGRKLGVPQPGSGSGR